MRISDWSSDVCSSDLVRSALTILTFTAATALAGTALAQDGDAAAGEKVFNKCKACHTVDAGKNKVGPSLHDIIGRAPASVEGFKYSKAMEEFANGHVWDEATLSGYLESPRGVRSEEHTSELQSLMRISYAVFCLNKKNNTK